MKKHTLGDGPIDSKLREFMNDLAAGLDRMFNGDLRGEAKKNGFILMVFPFGQTENPRCNYISNAQRAEIVIMLKEQIKRFEGQPEVSGRA